MLPTFFFVVMKCRARDGLFLWLTSIGVTGIHRRNNDAGWNEIRAVQLLVIMVQIGSGLVHVVRDEILQDDHDDAHHEEYADDGHHTAGVEELDHFE